MKQTQRIDGEAGERVIEILRHRALNSGRYIIELPLGDIYCRPGLDLKSREIATIPALLTARGNAKQQRHVHIHGALNAEYSSEEVIEVLMQRLYAGFPAALNGVFAAEELFAERDTEA